MSTFDKRAMAMLPVRTASVHGGYGWVRDLPDARDFSYAAPIHSFPQGLPPLVDLRPQCPPVYDQGQLGSCTANGIAAAIEFEQKKQGKKAFTPSRLFIYYNERAIEGTVNHDSGAQIRDGIKSVAAVGAPRRPTGHITYTDRIMAKRTSNGRTMSKPFSRGSFTSRK